MRNPISFHSVPAPDGCDRDRTARALTIKLAHLCESLSVEDRREMLGYLLEDGAIVTAVCMAIAAKDTTTPNPLGLDLWFSSGLADELRLALAPLLSDAVAESLAKAQAEAAKYRMAHDRLRALVHVDSLVEEARVSACRGGSHERIQRRREQYAEEWRMAQEMFPEYAPAKLAGGGT